VHIISFLFLFYVLPFCFTVFQTLPPFAALRGHVTGPNPCLCADDTESKQFVSIPFPCSTDFINLYSPIFVLGLVPVPAAPQEMVLVSEVRLAEIAGHGITAE